MQHYQRDVFIPSTPQFFKYLDDIPSNWGKQTLTAFAVGFTAGTIFTACPLTGLTSGALSALATVIHAAISPIFKYVVGQNRLLTWNEETLRGSLALIGTACIAAAFGNVHALNSLILMAIWHQIKMDVNGAEMRDVNKANNMLSFA